MLNETIEILTKQMIEESFEEKKNNQEIVIKMTKTDLYKFCIKLVKLIKEVDGK